MNTPYEAVKWMYDWVQIGTTVYVVTILKKARQQISDVRAELSAERADAVPAVFTKIHLHFIVTGKALKESQVKKAVELSAEKYCSASAMLMAGGVEITHDYEVVEEVCEQNK